MLLFGSAELGDVSVATPVPLISCLLFVHYTSNSEHVGTYILSYSIAGTPV